MDGAIRSQPLLLQGRVHYQQICVQRVRGLHHTYDVLFLGTGGSPWGAGGGQPGRVFPAWVARLSAPRFVRCRRRATAQGCEREPESAHHRGDPPFPRRPPRPQAAAGPEPGKAASMMGNSCILTLPSLSRQWQGAGGTCLRAGGMGEQEPLPCTALELPSAWRSAQPSSLFLLPLGWAPPEGPSALGQPVGQTEEPGPSLSSLLLIAQWLPAWLALAPSLPR